MKYPRLHIKYLAPYINIYIAANDQVPIFYIDTRNSFFTIDEEENTMGAEIPIPLQNRLEIKKAAITMEHLDTLYNYITLTEYTDQRLIIYFHNDIANKELKLSLQSDNNNLRIG